MEEIFSTDETKKKAIKYVLEIGRNKNIRNSSRTNQRFDKSASPSSMKVRGDSSVGTSKVSESVQTTLFIMQELTT
jgi:hypothetical protein